MSDLGGFYGSIDAIVVLFAEYFSAKFFLLALANTLFIRKKTKEQLKEENENKVNK